MNVLSLFDGASCCMVCLKRAGIPIDTYYGADIKKCAVRCEDLINALLPICQKIEDGEYDIKPTKEQQ